MRKTLPLFIVFIFIAFSGLYLFKYLPQKDTTEAKNTVINYLYYYSTNNMDKALSLRTSRDDAFYDDLLGAPSYIKLIKINNIIPENDTKYRQWYNKKIDLKNLYSSSNLKVININYTITYKSKELEASHGGIYTFRYFLVRNNMLSSWKIDYRLKSLPLY